MSPPNSSEPPKLPSDDKKKTTSKPEASSMTEFAFVNEQSAHDSRSHAMREHWKQRKRSKSLHIQTATASSSRKSPVLIRPLPFRSGAPASGSSHSKKSSISTSPKKDLTSVQAAGIPAQTLSAMNLALGSCRLDPFDKFPVKLTAQHHKLLLHWLTIYATMTFDDRSRNTFNPLRDVFFPLDLCNAASFNAVMAQSAAHLARMQGRTHSTEALKFKAEAIRILSEWMADENLALSDDVLAAISRILAYERYWGTEAEWLVHRAGLQRLINQRGGIKSLQNNWRLELTIYLISLMAKPSWFDSSNQLWELCDSVFSARVHPILSNTDALPRIRSLWLISFIQDTRTLMNNSLELYSSGITNYGHLQTALTFLYAAIPQTNNTPESHDCNEYEYTRLACILFIILLIQSSITTPLSEPTSSSSSLTGASTPGSQIADLDAFLGAHESEWSMSIERLYNTLFHNFPWQSSPSIRGYVLNLATVISFMSQETRRGVEKCLLNILPHVPSMGWSDEDDWTPDSLLSSIRGD